MLPLLSGETCFQSFQGQMLLKSSCCIYIYMYIKLFFLIQLTVFYFNTEYSITGLDSLEIFQTIQIYLLLSGWI